MSTPNTIPPERCPDPSVHGNPFLFCPYCTWVEGAPAVVETITEEEARRLVGTLPPGWTLDDVEIDEEGGYLEGSHLQANTARRNETHHQQKVTLTLYGPIVEGASQYALQEIERERLRQQAEEDRILRQAEKIKEQRAKQALLDG